MTTDAVRFSVQQPALWRTAQVVGLALTFALLGWLVVRPEPALHALWNVAIPLLPAVFLVNPLLWRNVCPLGTLNSFTGGRFGTSVLTPALARWSLVPGIVLLALMVPARRFIFNTDGPLLALTIVAVAILAVSLGFAFQRHAGFCNSICPVLPVEKLYGQASMLDVPTSRCQTCAVCTPVGCIELARDKTVAQTLGPSRRRLSWLRSPLGAFAAAFPGFIVGYFTTADGALSTAPAVYGHVALYALISFVIVAALVWALAIPSEAALVLLGGVSIGLYYWMAAPALAEANGIAQRTIAIRAAAAVLIGVWLWRARWRITGHRAPA